MEYNHENNEKWRCITVCGVEIAIWKQMKIIAQCVAKKQ